MTSKSIARNCEDIDETVLSFAEVKALATGDPRIKEKMDLDNQVVRLRILKSSYDNQRYTLEDNFTYKYPKLIIESKQRLECIIKDIGKRNMNKTQEFSININGRLFDEREKAGTILKSLYNKVNTGKELHIGTYQGLNLLLKKSAFYDSYEMIIHGDLKYKVELGDSPHGNMVRIENAIENLENSKIEYDKPFPYEEEYKNKLARQFELN